MMKLLQILTIALVIGCAGCDRINALGTKPIEGPPAPATTQPSGGAQAVADVIDDTAPDLLSLLGLAVPGLAGVGAYWRKHRIANKAVAGGKKVLDAFDDLVRQVERAKGELGDVVVYDKRSSKGKAVDVKATLMNALGAELPETAKLVKDAKARVRQITETTAS